MKLSDMKLRHLLLIFAALVYTAACSPMSKKNIFKDTRWKSEYELFVADAGTETITLTLKFVSAKEFILETKGFMPSHPATYMNADGTVPVEPERSYEYTEQGTYSVARNQVVLTEDNGTVHTLHYAADLLQSPDLFVQPIVFSRELQ